VGLTILAIAAWFNWCGISFLPAGHGQTSSFSHLVDVWLWTHHALSLYGWAAIVALLLVWSYWPRYGYKPEREMLWARLILIVLVVGGAASLLLPWIESEWSIQLRSILQDNSALTRAAVWIGLGLALMVLCRNGEVRAMLIGNGRVLSVVSLGVLSLVLLLVALGWKAG
jgi:hypothetical protein